MPVISSASGTTHLGPLATRAFSYEAYIRGLELEERTGMRLTRGPSMLARAKRITGLRTNSRAAHIDWFRTEIVALRAADTTAAE